MQLALKGVRLSFPDLFEAVQYENKGPFRYNATYLVVPGSDNDKAIEAEIIRATNEKLGAKAAQFLLGVRNNSNKFCYLDGNTKSYDGYAGMKYLSAHRKQEAGRPLIIDGKKQPLTAADGKPYAGCYVNATVEIYVQEGQNSGVRCGLLGVQFLRDGDAFSGGAQARPEDFEEIEEGATAEDLV